MKKYAAFILAMIMVCSMVLVGCGKSEADDKGETNNSSVISFADVSWTREGDHDAETIRFGSDGSFTYSCACGNPVGDYDLCEGYSYDEKTKTITLECIEEIDEMVTVIQVVSCDDDELRLDFDGEILIFNK